jgi:hypothetical protein
VRLYTHANFELNSSITGTCGVRQKFPKIKIDISILKIDNLSPPHFGPQNFENGVGNMNGEYSTWDSIHMPNLSSIAQLQEPVEYGKNLQ